MMSDKNDPRIPVPQDAVWAAVKRERDELLAEIERLKKDAREVCAPRLERQAREIERLRATLSRAADAPCSHCSAEWRHGERNTAHFIAGQAC